MYKLYKKEYIMDNITYKNNFNKEHYDRIPIMLPKGLKEIWKAEAKRRNMSLNALVQEAMREYLSKE